MVYLQGNTADWGILLLPLPPGFKNTYLGQMQFDRIVTYFLPKHIQHNKTHPRYNELRIVLSTTMIGLPLMLIFPPVIHLIGKPVIGFLINDFLVLTIILSIKFWGHYRIPMTITALVTYFIIYDWIRSSGYIYSSNVSILHMYLLAAVWADKRYGWWVIFTNLGLFGFIYYQTLHAGLPAGVDGALGSPLYALVMNALITVFFGGFLAYLQYDQESDRAKIRLLQDRRISVLDEAVKQRTEQLNTMRETIATDFHDETGNMLSAITRQASLLKLKLTPDDEARPLVESIIRNSKALYASSKDFLWHLHHNSDDPQELFHYLTSYGQNYYNQFDIAFSSMGEECHDKQFPSSAALNIIYIFKEAMTNVVKHSGAKEVVFEMRCQPASITYSLRDNGNWKESDNVHEHYGLTNMERRCQKNGFDFNLAKQTSATLIEVTIRVTDLNTNA
ncbi:hypothetical protein GCM10023149_29950 [Mucilaginibacter gynuensis]|uniref:histidine kinase n=1 Tax=Mucilaginibacter gynuensis TaxID=1302236 RepID=A0ABP8GM31_9SPHI